MALARDDLAIEMCALLNQTGQPAAAAALLASRRFQPWEVRCYYPEGYNLEAPCTEPLRVVPCESSAHAISKLPL